MPEVLLQEEFRLDLESVAKEASQSIRVISGYVKAAAVDWLADCASEKELDIQIVAGWDLSDLVSGASDLSAAEKALALGWRFGILPGLHAKVYWVDGETVLIGSANLTPRGLQLAAVGNLEVGVRIQPKLVDQQKLQRIINQAVWLDEMLISDIRKTITAVEFEECGETLDWPSSIRSLLNEKQQILLVDDCLMCPPEALMLAGNATVDEDMAAHDRALLGGISSNGSREEFLQAFRLTRLYRWLVKSLQGAENKSSRFGELTAWLHDALLDDPKPYRRDVKSLLANLIAWVEYLDDPMIEVRQHRRTKSLHLR